MSNFQEKLRRAFPSLGFKSNFSMSKITYFKVGGPAEVFVEVDKERDLIELVKFCRRESLPLTILGGASNVIVADEGVRGLVLRYTNDSVEVLKKEGEFTFVEASSGMKMSLLVSKVVELGLTGLEYFLGVPGLLGGAVYNNAHYLSDLIGEHIESVKVLDKDGQVLWLSHEECDFAYDNSRFQDSGEIILKVRFKLKSGNKEVSQNLIKKATQYRAKTQPLGMPSSGCIFQNVPNNSYLKELFSQFSDKDFVPGGFLIDQAGLKGEKEGDVEVSEKHAAFFVNNGDGTSHDLRKLISKVKRRVKEKFGVELEEEVFHLGD